MAYGTIKADGILDSSGDTLDILEVTSEAATTSAKGYMSAADKLKLDGVATGAEVNAVTSVNGSTGAVTVTTFSGDYADLTNKPTIPTIDADTVIDANYVATDENFTTADHTKLDGIEAGAQVNAVNTVVDANYVATDENFTTADHSKLDGIEAGAEVNAVTSVNGATGAVTVQGFSGDYDDLTNKPTLFSESYNDLSDKPTLGTAAATDSTAYATSTQGGKADTATQPGDLSTVATSGSYNDLTNQPSIPTVDPNTVIDANYVATDENFTTADHTKLDGVEAGAQVNITLSSLPELP